MEELCMKSRKILTVLSLAGILIAGAGCNMFDSQVPPNQTDPVKTADAPEEIESSTPWTKDVAIESSGMTKDGWQPIKNVTLPTVYFAYDRSTIGTSERYKLNQVGKYLNENKMFGLIVEGHCDEKGSAEYNRALGERRAQAIRDYLAGLGIGADRIQTKSYGEEKPTDAGHDEAAWAANRRGDFVLYY